LGNEIFQDRIFQKNFPHIEFMAICVISHFGFVFLQCRSIGDKAIIASGFSFARGINNFVFLLADHPEK
jgi:hypothetical protein